jgi:DNA-binding NarL/FixJ family response regulator
LLLKPETANRILIADHHATLLRGLREIPKHELGAACCGAAGSSRQVLLGVQQERWDLLMLAFQPTTQAQHIST